MSEELRAKIDTFVTTDPVLYAVRMMHLDDYSAFLEHAVLTLAELRKRAKDEAVSKLKILVPTPTPAEVHEWTSSLGVPVRGAGLTGCINGG